MALVAGLLYPVPFLVISEPLMNNVSFGPSKLIEKMRIVEVSEDLLILKDYYHSALQFDLYSISRVQTRTYLFRDLFEPVPPLSKDRALVFIDVLIIWEPLDKVLRAPLILGDVIDRGGIGLRGDAIDVFHDPLLLLAQGLEGASHAHDHREGQGALRIGVLCTVDT